MEDIATIEPSGVAEMDIVSAKTQLLQTQAQLIAFHKSHNIYRFAPAYEAQREFLLSGGHIRLAIGDNRSGKTVCGTIEDVSWALGFRPWILPEDYRKKNISTLLAIPGKSFQLKLGHLGSLLFVFALW